MARGLSGARGGTDGVFQVPISPVQLARINIHVQATCTLTCTRTLRLTLTFTHAPMHTSSPFSLPSPPRSSPPDYLATIWSREVGDLGLPCPRMAHSPGQGETQPLQLWSPCSRSPPTPLSSGLSAPGFSPIYQARSQAVKLESPWADKGAALRRQGALGASPGVLRLSQGPNQGALSLAGLLNDKSPCPSHHSPSWLPGQRQTPVGSLTPPLPCPASFCTGTK